MTATAASLIGVLLWLTRLDVGDRRGFALLSSLDPDFRKSGIPGFPEVQISEIPENPDFRESGSQT